MTTALRDRLPDRRTRSGKPVFQLQPRDGFGDSFPVLVSVDPPTWAETDELGPCQAAGAAVINDPWRCDSVAAYQAQPTCRRLALHDGPHAYVDIAGQVLTFEECWCVVAFDPATLPADTNIGAAFTACIHRADAVQAGLVARELTITIVDADESA